MAAMDTDPAPALLATKTVRHQYVKFGKPLARKFHELTSKYVQYEYLMAGDPSAGTSDPADHAWGETKANQLATASGISTYVTCGSVPFVNQTNSVGGATRLPGFLFSLTRCPNIIDDSGNTTASVQAMVPYAATGTGGFSWYNLTNAVAAGPRDVVGLAANGAYSADWQRVGKSDTGGLAGNVPLRYAMLKRSRVQLELWGQKLRTTKWRVLICQLDEDVNPTLSADNSDVINRVVTFNPASNGAKFWVNEFKKYAHHPWAATYTATSSHMKVLFSDIIWIDARSTMDESTTPQCVTKNYTFDFNRSCRFDWDAPTTNVEEADVNRFNRQQFTGNFRCDVDPNARIYLYIVAENFKGEAPAVNSTITADYVPSMNAKITNTWAMPTR